MLNKQEQKMLSKIRMIAEKENIKQICGIADKMLSAAQRKKNRSRKMPDESVLMEDFRALKPKEIAVKYDVMTQTVYNWKYSMKSRKRKKKGR